MNINFDFLSKDINFKRKINKKILRDLRIVLISGLSSVVIFSAFILVIWQNKDFVIDKFLFNQIVETKIEVNEPLIIEPELDKEVILKKEDEKEKVKSVIDVVKESNPAVVSVIVNREVPKYERVLNNETKKFEIKENGVEKKKVGEGSGFFIAKNGTIITNRHVVEGDGLEYVVYTNDGLSRPATILAIDPVYDVALMKVGGNNFSYLKLADSDKISVGESVVAIGNALGEFKNSVSVGVVSGLARTVLASTNGGGKERLEKVIQTDAAINPGNSGGPLIDLYGRFVGINVAVARGSENIGFALPINSVKDVISSVVKTGKIVRPYVGIRYVPITKEIQESQKLSVDYGVLILKGKTDSEPAVLSGSPAERAGLKENDIILSLDDKKITEDNDFALMIRDKKVGDTVKMSVLSLGQTKTVYLLLDKVAD